VSSAQQAVAQLAQTRAERSTYIANLANERTFNAGRIARLDAEARASAAETRATQRMPAQEGSATSQPATVATPSPPAAGTTLVVTATGYSLGGSTSTGLPAGWGMVAVDPAVIPPGYGSGVAADTGGGVHGAAIDLWFPTAAQADAWGRRTVTVSLH
jgi:3D (Asp-Asp-Asp) domain-containing protein